ncbi:MAG: STAS domain-containing protein [Acidimicrobiales bacterium]
MGIHDFSVTVGTVDGETVVHPRGELDLVTSPALRSAIESANATRVVVDFTDVDFMNTSGLSVLIALTRRLRADGGDLVVRHPNAMVRKTFAIAGVEELLNIQP